MSDTNLFEGNAFGVRIVVIPAGEFQDDDGRTISYNRGVKISTGKKSVKLDALQVLGLKSVINDPKFQESIKTWAEEEKVAYLAEMEKLKKL